MSIINISFFILCMSSIFIVYKYYTLYLKSEKMTKSHNDFAKFVDTEVDKITLATKTVKAENERIIKEYNELLRQYKLAYDVLTYLGKKYNMSMYEIKDLATKLEVDHTILNNPEKLDNEVNFDLDSLLDKINIKGYHSLTEQEKKYLSKHKK